VKIFNAHYFAAFIAAISLGVTACADDEVTSSINQYVIELPDWELPAKEFHIMTEEGSETRVETYDDNEVAYMCSVTRHDVQKNYEAILNMSEAHTALKPGMMIQGTSVIDGTLLPVPLPRSPLTLSIDLAVESPARRVTNPTSAEIQIAVSSLQREVDQTLPNLPARVTYTTSTVDSFEELASSTGVNLGFSIPLISAGLDAEFKNGSTRSARSKTVAVKLYQPMYTISFADDVYATARDFFADDISIEQFEHQQNEGSIGPDNLPTYVQSVTYGRVVIYTISTEELESSEELQAALNASLDLGFLDISGGGEVSEKWRSAISTSRVQVLALGGFATNVTEAIKTGDYKRLFETANATTAVPLSFRVNNLKSPRHVAVIGDTLTYDVKTCRPTDEIFTPGVTYRHYVNVSEPGDLDELAGDGLASTLSLDNAGDVHYDALQFDGYLEISQRGWYRFSVDGNDLVRFSVADLNLETRDGNGEQSAETYLEEGMYDISLFYWGSDRSSSTKRMSVQWESTDNGIERSEIPGSRIWHK
jgi:hypothetical protein